MVVPKVVQGLEGQGVQVQAVLEDQEEVGQEDQVLGDLVVPGVAVHLEGDLEEIQGEALVVVALEEVAV